MRSSLAETYLHMTTKYPKTKYLVTIHKCKRRRNKNDIIIVFMLYEKWWKIISIIKQKNVKKRE